MKTRKSIIRLLILIALITVVNSSKLKNKRNYFDFDDYFEKILDDIANKNAIENLDRDCLFQLKKLDESLKLEDSWALTVIDSFGRKPSGILNGNTVWTGEYSQCIKIKERNWNGKYCYISNKVNFSAFQSLNQTRVVRFKYGMCFPDKCNTQNLSEIFDYAIRKLSPNVLPFNSSEILGSPIVCKESAKMDAFSIIATIITISLIILVLVGTSIESYKILRKKKKVEKIFRNDTNNILLLENNKNEINEIQVIDEDANGYTIDENNKTVDNDSSTDTLNKNKNYKTIEKNETAVEDDKKRSFLVKILICFSAYSNSIKIFKVENNSEQFGCLHAIRVFSFFSVVLIHTWNHFTELNDLLNDNSFEYINWKNNFLFSIVTNIYYCVDTFFLLSGVLCSYTFLKQIKKKKLNLIFVLKFYLRRYYRITIPLILTMLFCVGLNNHVHTGPFYSDFYDSSRTGCSKDFWTLLIYINNIKREALCFPHSWYLANDMQFYWLAPIILIPFSFSTKLFDYIGYAISALFMAVHIISNAVVTSNFKPKKAYFNYQDIMGLYYTLEAMPWCRLAPFVIGLLLGKLILDSKTIKKSTALDDTSTKKILNVILWLVSLITLCIVIFGEHTTFVGINPMNRISQVFYITFSKILWSVAWSFIIYSCVNSNGGVINDFLSWSFWVPLSKLSFCAYLVHYHIVDTFIYWQDHPIHTQWSMFIYISTGNIVFALCLAYIASLLFEQPFSNLEKFIIKRD